jgi:hypothetical protein
VTDQPAVAQRRADIRSTLGQAHFDFNELLTSMNNEDLTQRSRSGWCARDVATHMVISIERVPALIEALRRGHDYLNFPSPVFERLRGLHLWWSARRVSWSTLARRLDAAYPPILALLETIRDDEWGRSGHAYGEGLWTVESALTHQFEHTEEHIHQIRELIGRTGS